MCSVAEGVQRNLLGSYGGGGRPLSTGFTLVRLEWGARKIAPLPGGYMGLMSNFPP